MHTDVIQSISIAIITAMLFGFVAKWLRQPLILGYMVAGAIVGKTQGLGWVATEDIEAISELGLILLLFMIGLEIDLKKLKSAGTPVVSSGIIQFLACVGTWSGVLSANRLRWREGPLGPISVCRHGALEHDDRSEVALRQI